MSAPEVERAVLLVPGLAEFRARVEAEFGAAREFQVVDAATARAATESLAQLSGLKAAAEKRRREIVKPLNDQVGAVNAAFKTVLAPAEEADVVLRSRLAAWNVEERRRVDQERREAEERQRRLAAEAIERQRAAEAEARRAEETARRLAEERASARRAVEAAPDLGAFHEAEAERERREAEAARQEEATRTAADAATGAATRAAEAFRAAPVAPPPVSKTVQAGAATASVKAVWRFEVTDPALVPREFMAVDLTAIRKAVEGERKLRAIPGVRIWEDADVQVRRRAW